MIATNSECAEVAELDAREWDSFDGYKWKMLVSRIQAGDPHAVMALYELMNGGVRLMLTRNVASHEIEDRIHNVFVIVLQAIQSNQVKDPERLMGFIWTVTQRQVHRQIGENIRARRSQECRESLAGASGREVEGFADSHQQSELMSSALMRLSCNDQEILRRFYIEEQPKELICDDLKLTPDQFRVRKSRAKAKLAEAGQMAMRPARGTY